MNVNDVEFFKVSFDDGIGNKDLDFFEERNYLGGWTVSSRHPVKGFKKRRSTSILPSKIVNRCSVLDLRSILEKTILKYASDKNLIFMSGGKDSTTLAHVFKKLDIPFKALTLYSDVSKTSEVSIIKNLEKTLDIEIIYYKINEIPLTNFPFWVENPYTAKVKSIQDLNLRDHTIFTGEIGTGEMQVKQSLQYTAMCGYKPIDLSYWHVNVCGSYRRINSVVRRFDTPIYMECVEHFINRFNEWDRHPDVLNRVMFSRLQDEGSYRIFNNGLDLLKWVHPYSESEFIQTCVNMPSSLKGSKNLYRLMYDDLTDIPWRYPKSGLGIPTV